MASRSREGTSVDWNATANWTGATVPVDGDSIWCDRGPYPLTTNLDQTGGDVDPLSFYAGGTFTGSIGDESTNTLKFDDISGFIEIDCEGDPSQILNIWADTCPIVRVHNTGSHTYACYLRAGTITDLIISGGQSIRLGGSLTVSGSVKVSQEAGKPMPHITFVEGLTFGAGCNIEIGAGVVRSYAAIAAATFKLTGESVYYHLGEGVGNITNTLDVGGNAKAFLQGGGWTVGKVLTRDNGYVDARPIASSRSGAYTFTNIEAQGGVVWTKRNDTLSNAPVEMGGIVPMAGTKTIHVGSGGGPGGG